MALSTRGRGAHSAPSGVTTSFRPRRFLNVSGMWKTIVSPSQLHDPCPLSREELVPERIELNERLQRLVPR
jgi:hypothetical protein